MDSTKYPDLKMQGYIKSLQGLFYQKDANLYTSVHILHNRINVPISFSRDVTARLDVRSRIFFGDQIKYIPSFSKAISQYNGLADLSWVWLEKEGLVGHSVIDRLWFSWNKGNINITVGRQRMNWGITNFWTLNDIFNTYNFLDFDYEERPGSDALKCSWQFHLNHSITVAAQPRGGGVENIYAMLYKGNLRNYDLQFILGNYHDYYLMAGGWAGSIGTTGFKGEWNLFHPMKNSTDSITSFNATLMADRTFPGEWYVHTSLLFNANPLQGDFNSAAFAASAISVKNMFPHKWTFTGGFSKSFSFLYSFSLNVIYSPDKNNTILLASLTRDMGSNFDLDLTSQIFLKSTNSSYRSEGNALYLRGKWSF